MITSQTIDFLSDIAQNNNREWFQENKDIYQKTYDQFKEFVGNLRIAMNEYDEIERSKVYRFYRDLRFTKDKTPYKTHYAAHLTRNGKYRRGGFYFQISAQEAMVAGGFWKPNRDDLLYIRQGIMGDADLLRQALNRPDIIDRFGTLQGDELITAPRGFDREHPDIDLLRKKQFLLIRSYPAKAALEDDFHQKVAQDFHAMIPVFDVITDFLVYDGNGVERE